MCDAKIKINKNSAKNKENGERESESEKERGEGEKVTRKAVGIQFVWYKAKGKYGSDNEN